MVRTLLSGGRVFRGSSFHRQDVGLQDGFIVSVADTIPVQGFDTVISIDDLYLVPGFVDVHVHLREPGFCYKETIASGTAAAARGGYTTVCSMPNLSPPPDCPENLWQELDAIKRDAAVNVLPYGCITKGRRGKELADMRGMAPFVCGFSDDGDGVNDEGLMKAAMELAGELDRPIAAHCEDKTLMGGANINDGEYARRHGLKGISGESEWRPIERDIKLAALTGCRYHVCHISTAESAELIRDAKRSGVKVTCETAPHYLLLCEDDLRDDGRFKMNPPLREKKDMEALRQALRDSTIDVIATDHAPHSGREKSKGLLGSAMGVSGLEAAFPVLYTGLVKKGVITLEKLIRLMTEAPRSVFGMEPAGIETGMPADITVLELGKRSRIDGESFLSQGKTTPFEGWKTEAETVMTICGGRTVWKRD